jgi:hypothetical protein
VPVHDMPQIGQRVVGHRCPVLIGDTVEQPDDIPAADVVDLTAPQRRQHQPVEHVPAFVDGTQPSTLARQVFRDDGLEGVALGALCLAALSEWVAVLGDGTEERLGLLASLAQRQPGFEVHALRAPASTILHDVGTMPLRVTIRPNPGCAASQ